ncbi:MAG: hypothetical protein ABIJ42_05090 [Acidobacteriota bacterium]
MFSKDKKNLFSPALAEFIPFRDKEACARVRAIKKDDICKHPNPEFRIRVIEDPADLSFEFAMDIVNRIRSARDEGRKFVGIFPVGPMPQYKFAARLINDLKLSCDHVHTFNMDEYADENGNPAPPEWEGSFQTAMMENFFLRIDEDLRPPLKQINFPGRENIDSYGKMIEDLGGADVVYGGIGWCGHIAFWETHLGYEFEGDIEAYKKAKARVVELHPMTIMQNALHSFSGDWSWVPPKAFTIGPAEILSARHRSFWLDGYIGGGIAWQSFIARLAAHGPVNPFVPGSILQTAPGDYTILGGVANDVVIDMR